ncbi:MAG: hypothetical protein ACKVOG_06705 [Rhodoglobus sp.]
MERTAAAIGRRRTMLVMRALITRLSHDRGDVPGWVLITLMTAGLVIIIWGLAGPALSSIFEQAIERVSGF